MRHRASHCFSHPPSLLSPFLGGARGRGKSRGLSPPSRSSPSVRKGSFLYTPLPSQSFLISSPHVYTSFSTRMYIFLHTYIHLSPHVYTSFSTRIYIFLHTYIHLSPHVYTSFSTRIYIFPHTYIHLSPHVYTSFSTRIYIFLHMYIRVAQYVYTSFLPRIGDDIRTYY